MSKFVIDVFLNSIVWVEDSELITNKYRYKIVSQKKTTGRSFFKM